MSERKLIPLESLAAYDERLRTENKDSEADQELKTANPELAKTIRLLREVLAPIEPTNDDPALRQIATRLEIPNRFCLLDEIGSGTFAIIDSAHDLRLNRSRPRLGRFGCRCLADLRIGRRRNANKTHTCRD